MNAECAQILATRAGRRHMLVIPWKNVFFVSAPLVNGCLSTGNENR